MTVDEMMKTTEKSPEMEKVLNDLSMAIFGRERDGTKCVTCGSIMVTAADFKDDLSREEFRISKMCQVCQDDFWGKD